MGKGSDASVADLYIDGFAIIADTNCEAGDTCQIADFRPRSNDTVLLKAFSSASEATRTYTTLDCTIAGATFDYCAGSWEQNERSFLAYAVEVFGDNVGDDDGLCEQDEACVQGQNFGAYQGHGELAEITSPTVITGVTLSSYNTNGG
jgi:hypothetical protein